MSNPISSARNGFFGGRPSKRASAWRENLNSVIAALPLREPTAVDTAIERHFQAGLQRFVRNADSVGAFPVPEHVYFSLAVFLGSRISGHENDLLAAVDDLLSRWAKYFPLDCPGHENLRRCDPKVADQATSLSQLRGRYFETFTSTEPIDNESIVVVVPDENGTVQCTALPPNPYAVEVKLNSKRAPLGFFVPGHDYSRMPSRYMRRAWLQVAVRHRDGYESGYFSDDEESPFTKDSIAQRCWNRLFGAPTEQAWSA